MLNDKTAKLISRKETYPDHANTPTITELYECPCKQGYIEYGYVPGFHDYWAFVHCEKCAAEYDILTGQGSLWELKRKLNSVPFSSGT